MMKSENPFENLTKKYAVLEAENVDLKDMLEKSRKSEAEYREWYYEQQKKVASYQTLVRYIIRELAVNIVTQMTHSERSKNLRELIWTMQGFSPSDNIDMDEIPF